jgi:RNA polymerase sigma-70 factor (ECF subfamily)
VQPDRAGAASEESVEAGSLVRLREAMAGLSEADREVIEMRHHGGMSFKQMSEVLEEPVGTLLARHHRALRKLREILETPAGDTPTTPTTHTIPASREVTDD